MASQDFSIYTGDSRQLNVVIVDGNGSPVDITGASIKWVIANDTSTLVTKNIGNGITITDGLQGKCTIALSVTDTQNLTGTYTHEARLVDANGNSSIVFTGTVTVTKAYV